MERRIILKPSRYRDRTGKMPQGLVVNIIRKAELRTLAKKYWAYLRNYFRQAFITREWASYTSGRPEFIRVALLHGLLEPESFYERSLHNRWMRLDYFVNSVFRRIEGWPNDDQHYVAPSPGVPNLVGRAW